MMKTRHLTIVLVVAMTSTAAHSEPGEAATAARTGAPVTVYVNARVHTGDEDLPRARAFVTRGDRFAFVGSAGDALRYAAGEGGVVDLQGRFVMPGIIDAHTHPGLVALSGDLSVLEAAPGESERPAGTDRMPPRPKEATLAWLRRYADDHPSGPRDRAGDVGCGRVPAARAAQTGPGEEEEEEEERNDKPLVV